MKEQRERDKLSGILQTLTVLISKPLNFGFMVLGIVIVYTHGGAIVSQTPIYGSEDTWMYISGLFVVFGLFLVFYCGYQVFFVKVRDQLANLNRDKSLDSKSHKDR